MPETRHQLLTNTHRIESVVYANIAARNAATGFRAGEIFATEDIGRLCYVTSTKNYYRLDSIGPATWVLTQTINRGQLVYTTGSLAADGVESSTLSLPRAFLIFKVTMSVRARFRLYSTSARRTADAARPNTTPPVAGIGLVCDAYEDTGTGPFVYDIMPGLFAANGDSPTVLQAMYAQTQNKESSTGTVTVTIDYVEVQV
jgi:hypothetical protein